MAAEGLPTFGQERGASKDVVFGKDFVAILLESPAQQDLIEIRSLTSTEPADMDLDGTFAEVTPSLIRHTRSSIFTDLYPQTSDSTVDVSPTKSSFDEDNNSSTKKSDKVVVLSVRVSSSSADSRERGSRRTSALSQSKKHRQAEGAIKEKAVIRSEHHPPSVVAESSRSDFSVEESEPITHDKTETADEDKEYPAKVQPLPGPQALPLIGSNSDIYQGFSRNGDKEGLSPYHHQTLIFHDSPHEPEKARSVSYTSVIQTLPQDPSKQWESQSGSKMDVNHETDRQERHYDSDSNSRNNNYYTQDNQKAAHVSAEVPKHTADIESNHETTESGRSSYLYHEAVSSNSQKDWNDDQHHITETTTKSSEWETTRSSYDLLNKPRDEIHDEKPSTEHQRQRIYGQPEQNYEVDESVSVISNGRVHGVQPRPATKSTTTTDDSTTTKVTSVKPEDNQKVGYVVEGRNYRKYRVEERTPDGFIVGEYGVVSHNDGSLRGVRYTADGTINPRLIYDALMKFLSL